MIAAAQRAEIDAAAEAAGIVLLRVAEECLDMSQCLLGVQGALGDLMAQGNLTPTREAIETLQDLDRLAQTMAAVSGIVRLAGAGARPDETLPRADLEAAARLPSLVARICDDARA